MRVMETFGKLPLSFEANQGQSDAQVDFLARVGGYTLFLISGEAVMVLRQPREDGRFNLKHRLDSDPTRPEAEAMPKKPEPIPPKVLSLKFQGASQRTAASGLEELPGKVNYFIGNDPALWHTDISTYTAVKYTDIYPGIDVVFYGNGQQLEWDLVVAAGADPDNISLELTGADQLSLDEQGNLVIQLEEAAICLRKPFVYQEVNGIKMQITGEYDLQAGEQIKFRLAGYDTSQPLVIDPVLVYSTYLGGTSGDRGNDIAVDADGNAYITGYTRSDDFPVKDPYQSHQTASDAFVSKLNADGSALIYSTYLGGNDDDSGYAIAVDADGYAYIAGTTYSTDFPVQPNPGAYQLANAGEFDAFVTKLDRMGNSLVFSTYLGGGNNDAAYSIAVDSGDNVYVTGETGSANFPRASAFQGTIGGGADVFVTKLNANGTNLVYSTFLGGSGYDVGNGIAVDGSGNAHVVGYTASDNFPTKNAMQPLKPASGVYNAFVAKYNFW